jgi:hypothetical protein
MCLNRQKSLKNSDFDFNCVHFSYNNTEASAATAATSKASDSPADDSDRDTNYEPERRVGQSSIPQYFKNIDIFPSHKKPKAGPEIGSKRAKIVDYTDETNVFPSPPTWEFQGLTESETKIAIENDNLILGPQQIETNTSENKIYC